jgi:hypothetical protein
VVCHVRYLEGKKRQMICVNEVCDSQNIKVAETRLHDTKNWIRRRRICKQCRYSWWTTEIADFELEDSSLQDE